MSVGEIEKLKGDIDVVLERKRFGELLLLRDQIFALVDESPYELDEILAVRNVRKPIAPKYRNPNNANETWTGRGRKPLWVVAHLEAGQSLESIMI